MAKVGEVLHPEPGRQTSGDWTLQLGPENIFLADVLGRDPVTAFRSGTLVCGIHSGVAPSAVSYSPRDCCNGNDRGFHHSYLHGHRYGAWHLHLDCPRRSHYGVGSASPPLVV